MGAFGSIAGSILGRVLVNRIIPRLGALEPGRYPHPEWGPIVVPPTPPALEPGEPTPRRARIQITTAGFLGAVALTYYLYERSKRKKALAGERPLRFIEPEEEKQQELFPHLRRELRLEQEEIPVTSEDPVEACLERKGWRLQRVRELKESIEKKTTPGMFKETTEEPFTSSEEELIRDIEACLDRIERQYGSLEAAGINLIPCPLCGESEARNEEVV